MPPTTSDRFFALADRVEAALSGVGIPAELTGALRSYWEQPTAPRLAVLVETANRLLFVPINEGTLDRIHPAILAYRAIDDAVGVFYDNDHPDAHTAATAHLDQCERLLARDALLPVRLVGGVWISADPAVASPIKDDPFTPTSPRTDADPRLPTWRPLLCFPDPVVFSDVVLPPRPATDYARAFAEYDPPPAPRRIFAVVALDGSGVWAIGDSAAEARAGAVDHRDYFRDCARSVDDDFPPPETDAAWLDTLALVTLSGTTESLRALIRSMETGDPVAPWCPADLWDSGEVTL